MDEVYKFDHKSDRKIGKIVDLSYLLIFVDKSFVTVSAKPDLFAQFAIFFLNFSQHYPQYPRNGSP